VAEDTTSGAPPPDLPDASGLPPAHTRNPTCGAPSKLTPEIQEKIVQLLARGNYVETAAAAAGVGRHTVYDWLKKGANQKRGKYREFADACTKAQADAEVLDLARLEKLSLKGDFRAITWRLERRNARRWGPQVQVHVHQVLDEYLGFLQSNLDAEVYEKVLAMTMAWDGQTTPKAG
jgi:transposase